jgi:zeaxanthin glucosyltransferase
MKASVRKTILVALYPEYSAYNGSLILARRLTERGFKVVYLTHRRFDTYLRDQGFETLIFNGFDDLRTRTRRQGLAVATRLRFEMAVEAGKFLENWMQNNPVELVLLDPLVSELAATTLKLGVPVIGLNVELTGVRNNSAPPLFSGRVPSATPGLVSRTAIFLSWLRFDLKRLHAQLIQPLMQMLFIGPLTYWRYSPLHMIKRYGGRVGWGEYGFRIKVPELMMAPREFDLPNVCQWTKRCYIGACVDPARQERNSVWENPADDRPLIYCSLGSYSHEYPFAARLFRSVMECGRRRPNWRILLHTGPGTTISLDLRAENVRVCRWVPQLEVLQRAALFITHGGLSSVRESIYYGVPMLIFPCRFDQPGNAARVVFHGLGLRGDIESVGPETLLCLLDQLLMEPRFRDTLSRFSGIFREQESCSQGADFIEQFIGKAENGAGSAARVDCCAGFSA